MDSIEPQQERALILPLLNVEGLGFRTLGVGLGFTLDD